MAENDGAHAVIAQLERMGREKRHEHLQDWAILCERATTALIHAGFKRDEAVAIVAGRGPELKL